MHDLLEVVTRPYPGQNASTASPTDATNAVGASSTSSLPQQQQQQQQQVTLRRHFRSSTKLRAILGHLQRLEKSDPDVKTVIFSQFTSMLDLCGTVLEDAAFSFVRLDGSMAQKDREKTLKRFADDDAVRCLLASTRSAGVGLNLVRASFVIMVEPWWNLPVEAQTIDRVHRIGQTRPVTVKRLIIKDSVFIFFLWRRLDVLHRRAKE